MKIGNIQIKKYIARMSETVQHQMCVVGKLTERALETFQFSATHNLHRGETHASLNSLKSNMWFWQQVIFQRKLATSCRAFSAFSIFCFCAPRSIHGNRIEPARGEKKRRDAEEERENGNGDDDKLNFTCAH